MSYVEIVVEVRAKTNESWLCYDGKTEAWVPISQINDYCEEKGAVSSIFISEGLAEESGFS